MANGFSVTITAVDHASEAFEAVNKRMQAFTRPARELQASLQRFSQASGISAITRRIDDLRSSAFKATEAIGKIVTPLGALTSAASIAGLYKLTTGWSAFTQGLTFSAQRMGVSAGSLHDLQNAAQLAGSSTGAVTSGLTSLQDAMTNAVQGRNANVANIFSAWHVSLRNADGSLKTVTQALPQLADRIAAIRNPTNQAQIATELFGGAAEDLLPFLRLGSRGIAQYVAQAQKLDPFYAGSEKSARQLQLAQAQLGLSVRGVGDAISVALAPVIAPLLGQLASWLSANRGLVQQKLDEYVKRLGGWLKGIDWKGIEAGVAGFASSVGGVVHKLGGWQTVGEGLVAFMGGRFLLGVLGPIGKITSSLTAVLRLLLLIPSAPLAAAGVAVAMATRTVLHKQLNDPMAEASVGAGGVPIPTAPDDSGNLGDRAYNAFRRRLGLRPTQDQSARAKEAYAYFTNQGWSPAQASGLVANLQRESGFDAGITGDSGKAFGLGQWHADRQAEFARAVGRPIQGSTFEQQLAFVQYELTRGTERDAGGALATARSAKEAGQTVSDRYERPGDAVGEAAERGEMAEDWSRRFAAWAADQKAAPTPAPTVDSTEGRPSTTPSAAPPVQRVQIELVHATAPPAGFRAVVKKAPPNVGVAMPADFAPGL